MKIDIIDEEVYTKYEKKNPHRNFKQTVEWAKSKGINGWKAHYFCCEDNDVMYTWLVLEKVYLRLYKVFYSPKGFAIDYKNEELIVDIYSYMKGWVQLQNGCILWVSPDEIEEPKSFKNIGLQSLEKMGLGELSVEMKYFYRKKLDRDYKELYSYFSKRVKYNIKKSKRYVLKIKELDETEIPIFYYLLSETSKKKEFAIRSLEYFEYMKQIYGSKIRFMGVFIDLEESILRIELDIKEKCCKLNHLLDLNKIKQIHVDIEQLEKELDELYSCKEMYGKEELACAGMYILDEPTEVIHMFGASREELLLCRGQYALHEYMMQYAIENGYAYYNFFGYANGGNVLNSLLFMKKGYCGEEIETIGDYVCLIGYKGYLFLGLRKLQLLVLNVQKMLYK